MTTDAKHIVSTVIEVEGLVVNVYRDYWVNLGSMDVNEVIVGQWGDEMDNTKVNHQRQHGNNVGTTTVADSFPPNGYDLYDIAGLLLWGSLCNRR